MLSPDCLSLALMQTKAALVREAYIDAEALVKRCLHRSHCFWNEQQVCPHRRRSSSCYLSQRQLWTSYVCFPNHWGLQVLTWQVVLYFTL